MFRFILVFFFFLSGISSTLLGQEPVDTIHTSRGAIVVFEDRTWEYLEDLEFDGVMNHHLNGLIQDDEHLSLVQTWDHDACYTSDRKNDLSHWQDTLWMCLADGVDSEFKIPVKGVVTSRYGLRGSRYHNGIDLNLNVGDTVYAAWPGKIRYAKFNDGGFGNLVIIRHDNGLETFYAHLSKHLTTPNQTVAAGEPIGLGGNTGHSRGAHLHFEVRFYDIPMNPEELIDFNQKVCKDENLFVHKGLFRPGAKPTDLEEHATIPTVASTAPSSSRIYYKIRTGDTLSAIAGKNRTTISKICQLNGIRPTTVIQAGKSLRVR